MLKSLLERMKPEGWVPGRIAMGVSLEVAGRMGDGQLGYALSAE